MQVRQQTSMQGPQFAQPQSAAAVSPGGNSSTVPFNFFTYTPNNVVVGVGQNLELWPPVPLLKQSMLFAVSPDLPRGITLEERVGVIHGRPQVATKGSETYFVTACEVRSSNSAPVKIAMVNLKVVDMQAAGHSKTQTSSNEASPQVNTLLEDRWSGTESSVERERDAEITNGSVAQGSDGKSSGEQDREAETTTAPVALGSDGKPIYMSLNRDGPARTVGSKDHPDCKPCAFYCYSLRGCRNGEECPYCHLYHESKLRQRRDEWKKAQREKRGRARKSAREEAAAEEDASAGAEEEAPTGANEQCDDQTETTASSSASSTAPVSSAGQVQARAAASNVASPRAEGSSPKKGGGTDGCD